MMLKEKSSQWARLKTFIFIPPAALLMLAFARPETGMPEASDVSEVKVTQIFQENQREGQQEVVVSAKGNKEKQDRSVSGGQDNGRKADHTVSILMDAAGQVSFDRESTDATGVKERLKKIMVSNTAGESYIISIDVRTDEGKWQVLLDSISGAEKEALAEILKETPGMTKAEFEAKQLYRYQIRVPRRPRSTPLPPRLNILLQYKDDTGKSDYVAANTPEGFSDLLASVCEPEKMTDLVLTVNFQKNDELQDEVVKILKEKGVEEEITIKKGLPVPPVAPLQIIMVYASGQKMYKDVWKAAYAENFINWTPVENVKEVILKVTPKCKGEMKDEIRNYLTGKGFSRISEEKTDSN